MLSFFQTIVRKNLRDIMMFLKEKFSSKTGLSHFFFHLRIYIYENFRCKFLLCLDYNREDMQKQENKFMILISKRELEYIICQLSFLKFSGENILVCTYFLLGVNFYYVRIIIRKAHKRKKTN
jgi:hypothetical protein